MEPGVELYVALEGLIDLDAEKERLDGEIAKVQKDLKGLDKKLGNPGFVAKAPDDLQVPLPLRVGVGLLARCVAGACGCTRARERGWMAAAPRPEQNSSMFSCIAF